MQLYDDVKHWFMMSSMSICKNGNEWITSSIDISRTKSIHRTTICCKTISRHVAVESTKLQWHSTFFSWLDTNWYFVVIFKSINAFLFVNSFWHWHWTIFLFQMSFSDLKGKVVLIQNTASLWGTTTRDFTQMNELCEKYGDKLVRFTFVFI